MPVDPAMPPKRANSLSAMFSLSLSWECTRVQASKLPWRPVWNVDPDYRLNAR